MLPKPVTANDSLIALATNTGNMLILPLKELPHLTKGKGNKLLHIPGSRVLSREEFIIAMAVLNNNATLVLSAGNKKLKLKPSDWKHYLGERGQRGHKLPRAFQKIDSLSVG